MVGKLLGLREEDQRDTLVAFCTLLAVMAGHSMLETARDALFLASLPATQLPWAYLAIAAGALAVTSANQRVLSRVSRRRALSTTLAGGAALTAGLWAVLGAGVSGVLFALYVWTGLLATVVVVQFWLHLGELLSIRQAKRVFAIVGAAGLLGAVLGAGAASLLLMALPPRTLILVAAGIFGGASFAPLCYKPRRPVRVSKPRRRHALPPSRGLSLLRGDPYLKRVFTLVLTSTVLVTGIDYVFKTVVAAEVPAGELGGFFAAYYAGVNTLALAVQLTVAPRLLRVLGVSGTLLVFPTLLLVGSVGFFAFAGLVPALLLKATDLGLRHSVNKTAVEILYVPLPGPVRERFKAIVDSVAQRGGQAVASVLILGAITLGVSIGELGVALTILAALWLACVVGLKPLYLDLFKRQLREGRLDTNVDIPELDLSSMEALVSALSSEDDNEVTAALDLFEQHGKANLVPALILYHPSKEVVLRAFELFTGEARADVIRLTGRLLDHEDPEIRAAALRVQAAAQPDEEMLRAYLENDCPALRATALLELLAADFATNEEVEAELRHMVDSGDADTRLALALTLGQLPAEDFAWLGLELSELDEPGLRAQIARSVKAAPHPAYLPALVGMLQYRDARGDARDAMVAIGEPALMYLDQAMADRTLPRPVRRHLPRTVSRFSGDGAVKILTRRLTHEPDETVVYKILRGLGRLRADDPSLDVDRRALLEATRRTLERAIRALDWRRSVEAATRAVPEALTNAAELLRALLAEKETNALERVFRLLHVLEPREEFRIIYDGLRSNDHKMRDNSRELLEYVVPGGLRDGILAMVDDASDDERLAGAAFFYDPPGRERRVDLVRRLGASDDAVRAEALRELGLEYRARLREMLDDPSTALRSIASYHIAELGLDELRDDVEVASRRDGGRGAEVLDVIAERALGLFDTRSSPREVRGAG